VARRPPGRWRCRSLGSADDAGHGSRPRMIQRTGAYQPSIPATGWRRTAGRAALALYRFTMAVDPLGYGDTTGHVMSADPRDHPRQADETTMT